MGLAFGTQFGVLFGTNAPSSWLLVATDPSSWSVPGCHVLWPLAPTGATPFIHSPVFCTPRQMTPLFSSSSNVTEFAGLTALAHVVFFWVHGLLLLAVPRGSLEQYKIQPAKYPPSDLVQQAVIHVGLGHLVAVPAGIYVLSIVLGPRLSFAPAEFSWFACCLYLVLYHVLFDTWFYWTHRALHHPSIYKYIHKQHHQFYIPVAIAAGYAHPLEDLFVNAGSTVIGPLLFPSHVWTWAIYYAVRMHETVDAHSGFDFPWSPWHYTGWFHGGASRHDWHHSHQTGNYGGFFFWDWLCGTDVGFRRWQRKQMMGHEGAT